MFLLTLRCVDDVSSTEAKVDIFCETDNPSVSKTSIRKFELSFLVKVFFNQYTVHQGSLRFTYVIGGILFPFPNNVKVRVNRTLKLSSLTVRLASLLFLTL